MPRSSHYLTMRDGARIAINLTVPDRGAAAPRKLPAILHQTRYMRSIEWRGPLRGRGIEEYLDTAASTRNRLVDSGYAWIDVDVRGSGASTGSRPCPWYRDEIHDGAEIVDWIIAQPWSSGLVGTTGVSYAGTCAEMLLTNKHPAVVACVPRFSLYDVYPDVASPGGVPLDWFTSSWSQFNRALDSNRYATALVRMIQLNAASLQELLEQRGRKVASSMITPLLSGGFGRALSRVASFAVAGVTPVDGDTAAVFDAVAAHEANIPVHIGAQRMTYRDDDDINEFDPEATIDLFSPHSYRDDIDASGAAILSYSGWYDGAYQNGAIKRFCAGASDRNWLLLGAWDHGGRHQISPHAASDKPQFDHDGEMLKFFDAFCRPELNRPYDAPPVRYFTMGAESWKSADDWSIEGKDSVAFHLRAGRALGDTPEDDGGADPYAADLETRSGRRSRWRTLLGLAVPPDYGDRARMEGALLSYTSAPLPDDLTVTGHPVVTLFCDSESEDGALFAYLEEVAPSGRVTYVTEGQLRFLHRQLRRDHHPTTGRTFRREHGRPWTAGQVYELRFDLIATSYRFRRGHSVRLSLACADADHFRPLFSGGEIVRVHRGDRYPSRIELPLG